VDLLCWPPLALPCCCCRRCFGWALMLWPRKCIGAGSTNLDSLGVWTLCSSWGCAQAKQSPLNTHPIPCVPTTAPTCTWTDTSVPCLISLPRAIQNRVCEHLAAWTPPTPSVRRQGDCGEEGGQRAGRGQHRPHPAHAALRPVCAQRSLLHDEHCTHKAAICSLLLGVRGRKRLASPHTVTALGLGQNHCGSHACVLP